MTAHVQGVRYSGASLGFASPGSHVSRQEAQYSFFSSFQAAWKAQSHDFMRF